MDEMVKKWKEEYYRDKTTEDERIRRQEARKTQAENALTIKKFNDIIQPLNGSELSNEKKELIIDSHLQLEEPTPHWAVLASEILDGRHYEVYKEERKDHEFFMDLYKQISKNLVYFFPNEDIAFSECDNIDRQSINLCFQLEHETAENIIEEFFETNNFIKLIRLKYISSLLDNPIVKSNLEYGIQHKLFRLWCENEANSLSILGLKFEKTNNMLGWELVKSENNEVATKPIEKIDWQGNQALLAYLFKELENKGVISNKSYIEYISNHFTVLGNDINKNSLKTAVHKARLDIKRYQDKKPIEKQIEKITINIPKLIDVLDELEKAF
jgi:hypothetical protein